MIAVTISLSGPACQAACQQELRPPLCNLLFFRPRLSQLSEPARKSLQTALGEDAARALCHGEVTSATDALLDSDKVAEVLQSLGIGHGRQSYLSLSSSWQHLAEWCSADARSCHSEYELLMFVGILGYPVDVQRRAATQMDPYAMKIRKMHKSLADTASLCCGLRSEQVLVPPEGGKPIEDLLVLVDPDFPKASRLIANSLLLRCYTSVVLCRDLHMYLGNQMRAACPPSYELRCKWHRETSWCCFRES